MRRTATQQERFTGNFSTQERQNESADGLTKHPRGRDQLEDLNIVSPARARSSSIMMVKSISINAGKRIVVGMEVLAEIVAKYVVTAGVVNHGDNWTVEFRPVRPNDTTLRTMLTTDTRENGALASRLPKVPGKPHGLTWQQEQEVCARLKMGEPAVSVARAYKIDVAAIGQLAR